MDEKQETQEEYSDPGEVAQEEGWTDTNDPWGRRGQPDSEAPYEERAQSSQDDGHWSGYQPEEAETSLLQEDESEFTGRNLRPLRHPLIPPLNGMARIQPRTLPGT